MARNLMRLNFVCLAVILHLIALDQASMACNQSSESNASNKTIPKFSLQPLDSSAYKLDPLGVLVAPARGFQWQQVSDAASPTYRASLDGNPNVFTLTIHPSAVSNPERKAFIASDWEALKKKWIADGTKFRNEVLPISKERFEYVEWLSVESENKGQQQRNLVAYGFVAGVTLRIHHVGPEAKMGGTMATEVLRKFQLTSEPKDGAIDLPLAVSRELEERITLLKSLLAKDDFRSILFEFIDAQEYSQLSSQSDVLVGQAVARFANANGALLNQAVFSLRFNEAKFSPRVDAVYFANVKPKALTMARKQGRWTLAYPKVLPDATAADVIAAEKLKPVPANPDLKVRPGKQLAISKVDDRWVMFSPFGKVPIPENVFEWKLVESEHPTIEATRSIIVEGNPNPIGSESLRIEVLPLVRGDDRKEVVAMLAKQAEERLKSNARTGSIESSLRGLDSPIPDLFEFHLLLFSGTAKVASSYASCLFLGDKTIVIHARTSGNKSVLERSQSLVQAIATGIKQDSVWYPQSTVAPEIVNEVSAIVAELNEKLAAGEYEEIFTRFVPPEQLAQIRQSPGGLGKAVEQFRERKSGRLYEQLKGIDWKTANYNEAEKTLSFGSSEIKFFLVDGKWQLR